ncbi:hypothetical protein MRX96_054413 [Rhipicephalus microplus]
MTLRHLNIVTPLLPRRVCSIESSDVEGLLPDMKKRIQVKPASTKSAHREDVFREIRVALNISGFLWDNKTRLKLCFNVLMMTSLIAAHVYLLKCAVNYETLDFVLYGTRIAASSATCFVTALNNDRFRQVVEALNEDAHNILPRRRVARIRKLCRLLTGVSLTIVLSFLTPPTYITFFTDSRTTAPLLERCLMYSEDLLFVVAIWYQLCFLPSLFVTVSHTIRELLSAHNDSLPRLFSRPADSVMSSPVPPLCQQLRTGRVRRDQIRKTFLECRRLYAPCLFFWYGMTFLGFCAELSAFTRQAESWVQRYYKILSCTHSWLTFWGRLPGCELCVR